MFTVAGWPQFAQQGGIANFFLKDNRVRFAINANVAAWFGRIGSRDSAEKSIHPAAAAGGMRA